MIKDIKYIIKKVIIALLIILVLSFIRNKGVFAKTEVYGFSGNVSNSTLVIGDNIYYDNTLVSRTYFNSIKVNRNLPSNNTWFLDFAINNAPTNEKWRYVYFSGYSNWSITVASANVLCENIANSSSSYLNPFDTKILDSDLDNNYEKNTMIPFAFRCIYSNSATYWVRLFGTGIDSTELSGGGTNDDNYRPFVLVNKSWYVTTDAQSTTEEMIQNQTWEIIQNTEATNEIKDAIKDDSIDNNDLSGKTSAWANKNASDAPISSMVTMPITLINAYLSGLNSSCVPYNFGNLFGTDLIMPCINISSFLGSSLWAVIDILFSGFMIFAIGKKFVKIFNDFTNLRDSQVDELYGGGSN